MNPRDVVILAATRTPIGAFQGALAPLGAPKLGAISAAAALERAAVSKGQVDLVFVGAVLPAAMGQAPARQVALGAGLPDSVPCTTVNKVCGSGLEAVLLGASQIRTGEAEVVLAGGMESMSNVPHYLSGGRAGFKLGDQTLVDGLVKDGLWDVYNDFHMGSAAELCAREMGIDRAAQDEFARESYRRALEAQASGAFTAEIVPVPVENRRGPPTRVDADEEPGRAKPERFSELRPAFDREGTVTAANASSLNDGAAMLVLASRAFAEREGRAPLATLTGQARAAQAPAWFTTAPAKAIERALAKERLTVKDVDLFEINEAFSVVSIANERLLGLDRSRVNVRGGAVALGHPIGASGARILVTLVHALAATGGRRGLAALCIGGGEGIAAIVER